MNQKQVTMNESTDEEVNSSTMQTKGAEKERKGNLDWKIFVENRRPYQPMLRVSADLRKMKSRIKLLMVTFLFSDLGTCLKL